jgi:hypothetical protein
VLQRARLGKAGRARRTLPALPRRNPGACSVEDLSFATNRIKILRGGGETPSRGLSSRMSLPSPPFIVNWMPSLPGCLRRCDDHYPCRERSAHAYLWVVLRNHREVARYRTRADLMNIVARGAPESAMRRIFRR